MTTLRTALNLLPPERKESLRSAYAFASLQRMMSAFVFLAVFLSATMLGVRMMLAATYDDLATRATTDSKEFQMLISDIRDINAYLTRLDGLAAGQTRWSPIIRTIGELTPPQARIAHFGIGKDDTVTISGIADTRDAVLLMQDRLIRSGMFKGVQAPIANILQQRGVKFDFSMTYVRPSTAVDAKADAH